MDDLSQAMRLALKFPTSMRSGRGDVIEAGLYGGPTRSTIRALVTRGYLARMGSTDRYEMTAKGDAAHASLTHEACSFCGKETHEMDAACIDCGRLKPSVQASTTGVKNA
jgi:hypothetical protein